MRLRVGAQSLDLELRGEGDGFVVRVDEASHRLVALATGPRTTAPGGSTVEPITFTLDGRVYRALVARQTDAVLVSLAGRTYRVAAGDAAERGTGGARAGSGRVVAPMPGKVTAVRVAVGDAVGAGQPLVTLEAMKMETTLAAEVAGTVIAVHVTAGAMVDDRTVLVELEPTDG